MAAPMLKAPTGRHGVSDADSGRPAKFPCRGAAATAGKTQPPCQKGQKGRKGAPRHDTHPLSGLSDLSGAGAPKKSSELTCHRWIARLPVFVVTNLSQTARSKPSSRLRVCSAARRRPSASRRISGNVFWFARLQRRFRVRKARKVRKAPSGITRSPFLTFPTFLVAVRLKKAAG